MKHLVVAAWACVVTAPALADDIEGMVRVVGSSLNQKVVLVEPGKFDGPAVCHGDTSKRVGRLTGMTVKVSGVWQTNKSGEKTCVEAKDFQVLKLPNGRNAIVGIVADKGGAFRLTGDDGKTRTLVEVPDGLRRLSGKKVIVDLKTIESPSAKGPPAKVVSYSEFP